MSTAIVPGAAAGDLPPHVLALVREEHAALEPRLDELVQVLARHGASEIWHKHGTFLDHLLGVWRILAAWRQPAEVCRLGLMHSIYSNSFVRMKLFDAAHADERAAVRSVIGEEAERLVHLFCTIRREELLPGPALFTGDGLRVGLNGGAGAVELSRRDLGIFLVVTMADYAEQHFAWQDQLFASPKGSTSRAGSPHALWPGDNRPGLWMGLNARLGRRAAACGAAPLPPVFAACTVELAADAERAARDLYWDAVSVASRDAEADVAGALREAVARNPFIAEPHVLLAQSHLSRRRWDEAGAAAAAALDLLGRWGTSWDKRLSWQAWIAWARVLLKGARERAWPDTAFGVISLGEVRSGL
jgi:hypothetical protein